MAMRRLAMASSTLVKPAARHVPVSWRQRCRFHSSSSFSSTIDEDSVAHFSRLSSQWWDPKGELALLHAMNPARLQFMRDKLREVGEWEETRALVLAREQGEKVLNVDRPWEAGGKWLQNFKTLDVGCGGGLLSESLSRLGANVTGIDASASNIAIAKLHAERDLGFSDGNGPRYEHIMAEDLLSRQQQQEENRFDVICAMEVIEHVKEPALFLRSLSELLKPGGHLFMSTIARTPLSYFLTIFMAENVLRLVSPGTHTHSQYLNPSELIDFFSTDIPWIKAESDHGQRKKYWPSRMQYETRGVAYLPWKSTWELAPRDSARYGSEMCNYFFWVRKPSSSCTL